ncbi:intraflagellar transport protein 43 homolog [Halichondria panicea]|uniref:intraflagellar transport protein 43 homolog n=1 Tax=Halichondria panicea TaxID=6063 RepID=UPI00312BAF57
MDEELSHDQMPSQDGPPQPRRTGRWAESMSGRDKGRKPRDQEEEDERLKIHDDSDDGLQAVPDLDDVQEEELTTQVALPPSVTVTRVATFKQLDSDLHKHAGLFTLDGMTDMKILTKGLLSEAEVTEEDKPWEWNRLLAEISSDIQEVWDRREGAAPRAHAVSPPTSIKGGLP